MSEAGDQTSSFAIRLTTEPLGTVYVYFGADSTAVDPARVVFNYTNYDTPQTVSVTAVDDSIDQGAWYLDHIDLNFTSTDVCADEDTRSLPCGQCVEYDGFKGVNSADGSSLRLPVNVTDDDTAGVALTTGHVNTSIDNYGDALGSGMYGISLTSEPRHDVTLDLSLTGGADSRFSYTDVSSATFTAEDWDTVQFVTVTSSAATGVRPVCQTGLTQNAWNYKQACDELSGRTDTISHAITSSDPFYTDATTPVPSIKVSSTVFYDPVLPPFFSSAKFTDLLNGMLVTFDKDTAQPGGTSSFECVGVLNLTVTKKSLGTDWIGDGAMCSWLSEAVLKVTFGSGPTVVPGDVLHLKDSVVQSSDADASLFAMNQSTVILGPDRPTVPAIAINAPEAIGVCDDLKLDSSSTWGSGGRRMVYNYSVACATAAQCENVTAVLVEANAANNGYGTHTVTIPADAMPKGIKMEFTLMASNFLGETASKTTTVAKLGYPAPFVAIQGANPRKTTHSEQLVLRADARLPEMDCVADSLSDAKMTYIWSETTGKYTGSLSTTNPRILRIASEQLQATESYEFQCFVALTSNSDNNNTASVVVDVKQQPIIAKIAGGKERKSGTDQDLVLDAGESVDPDGTTGAWEYQWSCINATGDTACLGVDGSSALSISPNSTNVIARLEAGMISEGTYEFSVFVKKETRNDTATATVVITAGAPPTVTIATLSKAKYNPIPTSYVQLSGSAKASVGPVVSTEWTQVGSAIMPPPFIPGSDQRVTSVVRLDALTAGVTYTFKLSCADMFGETSYSTVEVVMNEAPRCV